MNIVFLIGRMVADPELTFAAGSGIAICRFRLAVTRPFKKDETDFINCIAFNKKAETIANYMAKGRQLAIKGHIQTGSFDAKDGTKRYTTDVMVDDFKFIDSLNNKNNNSNNTDFNDFNDNNSFGGMNFEDDMVPVDDGDMPF